MADYDGILSLSGGITKRVNSSGDTITIRPALKFEGSTDDDNETTLAFEDPTADRTITFPNATGNVLLDSQNIDLADNVKILLGTGDDLEIFHNGSNNIIKGTGGINVQTGDFQIVKLDGSSTVARFQAVAGIELYHNGTKKLETTSAGIQTTGNISVNGAYTLPTADGNENEVLTTDGSGAVTFQPISSLDVPSFLVYGQDASLSNQTSPFEMKTTNGSQNGQGWRMPVGGSVTHMSLQLDLENAPTSAIDVVIELYKNGSKTSQTLTLPISSTSNIGDFGANGAITPVSFNAGDCLTVFIKHSASGLQTGNHAVTVRILTATT